MQHINFIVRGAVFWLALLALGPALAEISITLKNSFIEKYKNRATIDAKFSVDHSNGRPNPASKDGDMLVQDAIRPRSAWPLTCKSLHISPHGGAFPWRAIRAGSAGRLNALGGPA
jgi:hypothetical protein